MKGLAEEYSFACKLLADEPSEDNDDMSDISEDIRRRLLELLFIIHDTFPFESAIDYDSIKHFRIAMGNTHTKYDLCTTIILYFVILLSQKCNFVVCCQEPI